MAKDFLGIRGYRPAWITDPAEFRVRHEGALKALLGARVKSASVLWDVDADSHFDDGPVVIRFESGPQAEICCNKFDEVSLTFDTIDLKRAVTWEWFEPQPLRLAWGPEALTPLTLAGSRLSSVKVLEIELTIVSSMWCLGGLDLQFEDQRLTIFNGLDCTKVSAGLDPGGWRTHSWLGPATT